MTPELKKKWIDALCSGDYQQGQRFLRRRAVREDETYETWCCLGVLIDVSELEFIEPATRWGYFRLGESNGIIEGRFRKQLGLPVDQHNTLANMNDEGLPFSEIADWILRNV